MSRRNPTEKSSGDDVNAQCHSSFYLSSSHQLQQQPSTDKIQVEHAAMSILMSLPFVRSRTPRKHGAGPSLGPSISPSPSPSPSPQVNPNHSLRRGGHHRHRAIRPHTLGPSPNPQGGEQFVL
ncbi:hypothetical protein ACFE04_029989 [Oxalis oulophora]